MCSGGRLGVPDQGREGVAGGLQGGEVRPDGHQPGPVVGVRGCGRPPDGLRRPGGARGGASRDAGETVPGGTRASDRLQWSRPAPGLQVLLLSAY